MSATNFKIWMDAQRSASFDVPDGFIVGLDRNPNHNRVSHLYKGDFHEPGLPMCRKGWNRGGGYSIWRGQVGDRGICKTCMKRALAGLPGVPLPPQEPPNE